MLSFKKTLLFQKLMHLVTLLSKYDENIAWQSIAHKEGQINR